MVSYPSVGFEAISVISEDLAVGFTVYKKHSVQME